MYYDFCDMHFGYSLFYYKYLMSCLLMTLSNTLDLKGSLEIGL